MATCESAHYDNPASLHGTLWLQTQYWLMGAPQTCSMCTCNMHALKSYHRLRAFVFM